MDTHAFDGFVLPDLLRIEHLCLALGRGKTSVRRLCRTGAIPATKLGRQWVADRRAFLAALRPLQVTCADCCRLLPLAAATRRASGIAVCRPCAERLDHLAGGRP